MKVLFATMQFGHDYGQGTERYIAMLMDGLSKHGHNALVLGGDPEQRGGSAKLGTVIQAAPRILHYPTRSRLAVQGVPPHRLIPLLRNEQPGVVHLVNPGHVGVGIVGAARALDIPVVITVVDYWWRCPKGTLFHRSERICDARVSWLECMRCLGAADRRGWMRQVASVPILRAITIPALYFGRALAGGMSATEISRWIRRQEVLLDTLNAADAVVFLSAGARGRIAPRLAHDRTHTIIVGMEDRWFEAQPRQTGNVASRPLTERTIGFVGALEPHKGPHLLLQALRNLGWTQTEVRLIGGGPEGEYRRKLEHLADGLNLTFVGRVPSADMPAQLRALDLLVVPSMWPENLPQTVLEAQAVGVPVIASNVDGIAEVITDQRLLFDVGSATDLARVLKAWSEQPSSTTAMTPVRRASQMVNDTIEVYEHVRGGMEGP